jgi:hypothetical protein
MQRTLCPVRTREEAEEKCPWAAEIIDAEEGFCCFESVGRRGALSDRCLSCCADGVRAYTSAILSLRSRCTAMLAGLRTFDPDPAWAGSIGAVHPLGNNAPGPTLARTANTVAHLRRRARLEGCPPWCGVVSRECGFAVEKRKVAQILAIVLDQVERIEDCGSCCLSAAQFVE